MEAAAAAAATAKMANFSSRSFRLDISFYEKYYTWNMYVLWVIKASVV